MMKLNHIKISIAKLQKKYLLSIIIMIKLLCVLPDVNVRDY